MFSYFKINTYYTFYILLTSFCFLIVATFIITYLNSLIRQNSTKSSFSWVFFSTSNKRDSFSLTLMILLFWFFYNLYTFSKNKDYFILDTIFKITVESSILSSPPLSKSKLPCYFFSWYNIVLVKCLWKKYS